MASRKGPRRIDGAALDVTAAGTFLGMTPKTVRRLIERRRIPFRRVGRRVILVRSELDEWLRILPGASLEEALARQEGQWTARS